jgi:hypothetical protein
MLAVPNRLLLLASCLTVTLALIAAQATAATGPGNQRWPITQGALELIPNADRDKWRVQDIKRSSVNRRWAIASMNPKPQFAAELQSFVVVLIQAPRLDNSTRWVVADFGNAFVGCDIAPLPVLRDLYVSRTPCSQ